MDVTTVCPLRAKISLAHRKPRNLHAVSTPHFLLLRPLTGTTWHAPGNMTGLKIGLVRNVY